MRRRNPYAPPTSLGEGLSHPFIARAVLAQWGAFFLMGVPVLLTYVAAPEAFVATLFTALALLFGFSWAMVAAAPAPPVGAPRLDPAVARGIRRHPATWAGGLALAAAGLLCHLWLAPGLAPFLAAPGLAAVGFAVGLLVYFPQPVAAG